VEISFSHITQEWLRTGLFMLGIVGGMVVLLLKNLATFEHQIGNVISKGIGDLKLKLSITKDARFTSLSSTTILKLLGKIFSR
tara:strand:+ start:428 stop:676 length:249 start_codon:yes stop_codon:yes gene_type:complete